MNVDEGLHDPLSPARPSRRACCGCPAQIADHEALELQSLLEQTPLWLAVRVHLIGSPPRLPPSTLGRTASRCPLVLTTAGRTAVG